MKYEIDVYTKEDRVEIVPKNTKNIEKYNVGKEEGESVLRAMIYLLYKRGGVKVRWWTYDPNSNI